MITYYINRENYINEICNIINIKEEELIKKFFLNGIIIKNISFEKIIFFCKKIFNLNIEEKYNIKENINYYLISVIGDVNSGKTTLIDFIFKKNICINEIGKITQFVSMLKFNFKNKNFFLIDLPGHELFDIVIENFIKLSNVILLIVSIETEINNFYKNILILLDKNINVIICLNKIDILNKNFYFKNYKIFKISSKNGYNVKRLILNSINYSNNVLINDEFNGFIINSYFNKNDFYVSFFLLKGCLKLNDYIYFKSKKIFIDNIYLKNKFIKIVTSPSIFLVKNIDLPVEFFFSLNNKYYKNIIVNNKFIFFVKSSNHTISISILDYFKKNNKNNFKISIGNFNINDLNYCINFKCRIFLLGIIVNQKMKKEFVKNNIFFKEFNLINDFISFIKKNDINNIIKSESKIINLFKINNDIIAGSKIIKGELDFDDYIEIYKQEKIIFKGNINTLKIKNKNISKISKNKEYGITFKNFKDIEIGMKFFSFKNNNDK